MQVLRTIPHMQSVWHMQNSLLSRLFWVLLVTRRACSKPFPVKSQLLCSNNVWCSAPISSHRNENRRVFYGHTLMKLNMSTALSSQPVSLREGSSEWFTRSGFALWLCNCLCTTCHDSGHQCIYWHSTSSSVPPVQDTQWSHNNSPLRLFW